MYLTYISTSTCNIPSVKKVERFKVSRIQISHVYSNDDTYPIQVQLNELVFIHTFNASL